MKNKSKELDVDFIGDGKPLTKEEELTISDFIRKFKENQKNRNATNSEVRKKQKIQILS